MAQQSARRGRKNQGFPPCREHAVGDVVPVRELPYGPAASDAASEAGQMAASDYVHYLQKTACVFWGVHRWEADLSSPLCQDSRHLPLATGSLLPER